MNNPIKVVRKVWIEDNRIYIDFHLSQKLFRGGRYNTHGLSLGSPLIYKETPMEQIILRGLSDHHVNFASVDFRKDHISLFCYGKDYQLGDEEEIERITDIVCFLLSVFQCRDISFSVEEEEEVID